MKPFTENACKESIVEKSMCAKLFLDKAFGADPIGFDQVIITIYYKTNCA